MADSGVAAECALEDDAELAPDDDAASLSGGGGSGI